MSNEEPISVTSPRSMYEPTARLPVNAVLGQLTNEDVVRLRRILSEPIEFLFHESFDRHGIEVDLFGAGGVVPWLNSNEAGRLADRSAGPSSTLSTDEERSLFLKLNYSRRVMTRILKRFAGKRLTARATSELLAWHAEAVQTRCSIVQANVPLVLAMAKRTRLSNMDYAELISEGNMALLRSVDKFDCGRGFKFSTYACRAILKSFSRVALRTGRYRSRFPTEFDPTLEKSDHLDQLRARQELDCLEDLREMLSDNVADLNEVETRVIQARFALNQVTESADGGPKTLEQVGLLIGVTKERVRQIQNRALEKLRAKLQDDYLAA